MRQGIDSETPFYFKKRIKIQRVSFPSTDPLLLSVNNSWKFTDKTIDKGDEKMAISRWVLEFLGFIKNRIKRSNHPGEVGGITLLTVIFGSDYFSFGSENFGKVALKSCRSWKNVNIQCVFEEVKLYLHTHTHTPHHWLRIEITDEASGEGSI